jgi:hypothetical protein
MIDVTLKDFNKVNTRTYPYVGKYVDIGFNSVMYILFTSPETGVCLKDDNKTSSKFGFYSSGWNEKLCTLYTGSIILNCKE